MTLLMFSKPLNCSTKEAIKLSNRSSLIAIKLPNRGWSCMNYQAFEQGALCIVQYGRKSLEYCFWSNLETWDWKMMFLMFSWLSFNRIQDRRRGSQKAPTTSFAPVTSTNVRIRLQKFLTFSVSCFATLV